MERQVITFRVGESLLGIDITIVKEIHRKLSLNEVPGAQAEIRGLVNLRGKIVTILDLERYLWGRPRPNLDGTRLLILKSSSDMETPRANSFLNREIQLGEDIVGLIIDSLDEVLTVDTEEVLPTPPNLSEVQSGLIEGVIKLKDRLLLLLDVTNMLRRARAQAD